MDEVVIESFAQFHELISADQKNWSGWYYRGHSLTSYELRPKAGRRAFVEKYADDVRMFEAWKRHAVAYIAVSSKELTDWDYLAIAQHHGLATRLLDWSFNPLNAMFFAVGADEHGKNAQEDAVVYGHYSPNRPLRDVSKPFELPNVTRVAPASVTPRIIRQGGIFTIHNPPTVSLADALPAGDQLKRFLIKGHAKKLMAEQLSHYGVNRLALFPDLDGLSTHVNWVFTSLEHPRNAAPAGPESVPTK